jgi:immunity-specific protein beta241|nr:MAG TPA: tail tape measure protein [Caudoviricetes sp.]
MAGKSAILAVKIISDAKPAIEGFKQTADGADGLGGKLAAIGPGALAVGGAIVTGVVAVGKAMYDLGSRFDEVADTIRVGTGATGEALDGLVDVAHGVATTIPTSFEQAGTTVADVNTRLGLTGDTLQTVASQYLEAGRILGSEVDIAGTSAAFSAFGIQGEAVSGALDELFQVSQATGVGMNELASSAQKNAGAMQELGFGFEDSVRMVGVLNKAGLDADATLGAMRKGLLGMVKPGEDMQDTFKRVTGEIQGYIDAGDSAAALNEAKNVFGAKGADEMVRAIQTGVLSMNDLTAATGQTQDTILGVGKDTMDAAEKWEILKNRGLEALEPLASGVFDFVGDALGAVLDWLDTADFTPLMNAFSAIQPAIDAIKGAFSSFDTSAATGAFTDLQPTLQAFGTAIGDAVPKIMSLAQSIQGALTPIIEALAPIVTGVMQTIGEVFMAALDILTGAFTVLQGLFTGDWQMVWDGVGQIVDGAINLVVSALSGWFNMMQGFFSTGVSMLQGLWSSGWEMIKNAVSNGVSSVISTVAGLPSSILSALGNLGSLLYNAGSNVISGFINGIRSKASSLASAAIDTVKGGVDAVLNFLGIHSPSRLFYKIGGYTGEGMVLGIRSQADAVADAWDDMMTVPDAPRITVPPASLSGRNTPAAPVYNINVSGVLDGMDAARKIREVLAQYDRVTGTVRMGARA